MTSSNRVSAYNYSEEIIDYPCNACETDGKNVESVKYCVDCNENLCSTCIAHHDKFPATRKHTVRDCVAGIEEIEATERELELDCGNRELEHESTTENLKSGGDKSDRKLENEPLHEASKAITMDTDVHDSPPDTSTTQPGAVSTHPEYPRRNRYAYPQTAPPVLVQSHGSDVRATNTQTLPSPSAEYPQTSAPFSSQPQTFDHTPPSPQYGYPQTSVPMSSQSQRSVVRPTNTQIPPSPQYRYPQTSMPFSLLPQGNVVMPFKTPGSPHYGYPQTSVPLLSHPHIRGVGPQTSAPLLLQAQRSDVMATITNTGMDQRRKKLIIFAIAIICGVILIIIITPSSLA